MRKASSPHGVQLAIMLFLGVVGLGFFSSAVDYYKAKQSASWPQVEGRVVQSGVAMGCRRGGSFAPVVSYTYADGGATLTGNRLRFGSGPCGDEADARAIAARYPVGARLRVSVNPDDTSESVLSPGEVPPYAWLGFAVSALLFASGAVFALQQRHA